MTDVLTPPVKPPRTELATEQDAREVAEGAREKEWQAPSFVRELFEGSFRSWSTRFPPWIRRTWSAPGPSWSGWSGS